MLPPDGQDADQLDAAAVSAYAALSPRDRALVDELVANGHDLRAAVIAVRFTGHDCA